MIGRFVNRYSGIIELLPYFIFEINTILRIVYKDSQSKKTSISNIVSYAQTSLIDDSVSTCCSCILQKQYEQNGIAISTSSKASNNYHQPRNQFQKFDAHLRTQFGNIIRDSVSTFPLKLPSCTDITIAIYDN